MFQFRKYAIWCYSIETYLAAEKKAFEFGYGWGSPGNAVSNPEPFNQLAREREERERQYPWRYHSHDRTLALLLHDDGTITSDTFVGSEYIPKGHRLISETYTPVSEYHAPTIQKHLAQNRNYEQKVCYATDEFTFYHGRADVFEIRWDRTVVEYEVKVSKADFESEMAVLRDIAAGNPLTHHSKGEKHSAYLGVRPFVNKGTAYYEIIPDYLYFVVPPYLEEHCKKALKGTPYGLMIADSALRGDKSVHTRFDVSKQPRKLPGAKELSPDALWNIVFRFGDRARTGRNRLPDEITEQQTA